MQNAHTIKDVMVDHPIIISPDDTLKEAAQKMEAVNCGFLPVGKAGKIDGVITDRDIVLRAVAKGKDVSREKVKNFMTTGFWFCRESDTLAKAARMMHSHHVNRLLVKNAEGVPSGIVSFGRLLRHNDNVVEMTKVVENVMGRQAA